MSLASRLYHGETSFDIVGRRRLWFTISGVLLLVSLISLFVPGLNFGIDFKGGAVFRVQPAAAVTEAQVRQAIGPEAKVVQVTEQKPVQVIVQTEELSQDQVAKIRTELAKVAGVQSNAVSTESIGSKWGSQVSRKALLGLLAFLLVVTVYVSFRMEWKMAVAALVALVHDLIITAGIYALARFEVTPATVIAVLTILGYSLYDTVVVFDKVRENTGPLTSMSRTTYSDATNLAVNQTIMRSLNTSLASLLPIAGLLIVGAFLLGAETLKDLALALFVGVAAGTYSSIFIAPPLVAAWKEREPRYQQLRARVERLAAQGAAGERPERAGRAAASGRGGRAAAAADGGRTRAAGTAAARRRGGATPRQAPPPEPAAPGLVADDELEAEALPAGTELADVADGPDQEERAAVAPAPTRRQPQKPRPAQQRRKPSGRQPSRPAKRRRR
ncbi:MAG TPA: protein translocase subunit SecF [Actinomycetota bacterium]|nr:protein translocase subunit SecF [Actinomycetota bacterium]